MDKGKEILKAWKIVNKTFEECMRLSDDFKQLISEIKENWESSSYSYSPTSKLHLKPEHWEVLYNQKDKDVDLIILEYLFHPEKLKSLALEEPALITIECSIDNQLWNKDWWTVLTTIERYIIQNKQNKLNEVLTLENKRNVSNLKYIIIPLVQISCTEDIQEKIISPLLEV